MKEAFESWRPNRASLATIAKANEIITEYLRQGYSLTLRQIYYQFVARGLLENKQQNYKNLGSLLSKARLAGLVDWRAMEDRTRNLAGGSYGYDSVADYMGGLAGGYAMDIWRDQDAYCEVWVEKEALAGVVEKACANYRVAYFCCRGNVSQSEQYKAGKRFEGHRDDGRECHVFHLGDHDPSGIDMTRDNLERLDMFSSGSVQLHRIALNMDQIEELNPPPNPAKESDSRYAEYARIYGTESWELDALSPDYINNLVNENLGRYIDHDRMQHWRDQEEEGQADIQTFSDHYEEIREFMRSNGWV